MTYRELWKRRALRHDIDEFHILVTEVRNASQGAHWQRMCKGDYTRQSLRTVKLWKRWIVGGCSICTKRFPWLLRQLEATEVL